MVYTESFKKLIGVMTEEYLGKQVPKEFQERYGKTYDKEDIKSFAYAVARSRGIKIDKGGKR